MFVYTRGDKTVLKGWLGLVTKTALLGFGKNPGLGYSLTTLVFMVWQ